MSKPDWKYAPDWAMWLAQDGKSRGGYFCWFASKPKKAIKHDLWLADFHAGSGKFQIANGLFLPAKDWTETLEPRPC